MASEYIHFRVDADKKKEAERILNALGLTITTGMNLCINSIIRTKGLPFDVKLSRSDILGENDAQMEAGFQRAVSDAIVQKRANGNPVALYDAERNCPYLEYPDGRREYDGG